MCVDVVANHLRAIASYVRRDVEDGRADPGGQADLGPLLDVVRERYRPHVVLAAASQTANTVVGLLEQRSAPSGRASAYVCRNFACEAPVGDPAGLRALLDG